MEETTFVFSRPRLEALPAPAKGFKTYHDAKPGTRGVILTVTANGVKTFYVRRRVNGQDKRIRVGRFPEISVEQARKIAELKNGLVAAGEDPTVRMAALREEPTLDELFEDYMASPRKRGGIRKGRTVEEYRRIVTDYLGSFRKRKVSMLTFDEMDALHKRVAADSGPYAANRMLAVVKAVYNFGIDRKRLKVENPAKGVVAFPEATRERRLWDDEVKPLFTALDNDPDPDIRDFVLLALLTGARKNNILAMRWEDVLPLERELWRVPETKSGQPQMIPLMSAAVEILQDRMGKRHNAYVFPGDGRTGHLVNVTKMWSRVLKNAGLKDLRLHDLRRTLGSYQVDTGATLETVGKTLGHKSSAVTAVYARMAMDPVRQSMKAGTAAILRAGGRLPQAEPDQVQAADAGANLPGKRSS